MSDARLVVDLASGVAPWRQIRDQLVRLIAAGALPVGSRLPPIRQIATDLGLAPGTVARVYRELEADGVVTTARRRGTVVAAAPTTPLPARPLEPTPTAPPTAPLTLPELAAAYVAHAIRLGEPPGAIVDAVRAAVTEHRVPT